MMMSQITYNAHWFLDDTDTLDHILKIHIIRFTFNLFLRNLRLTSCQENNSAFNCDVISIEYVCLILSSFF